MLIKTELIKILIFISQSKPVITIIFYISINVDDKNLKKTLNFYRDLIKLKRFKNKILI